MSSSLTLSARVKEVLLDGKWIANTNYKEQIDSINWKDAVDSFEGLNSIALLTFHINYYLKGLNEFFAKGELNIHDEFSFDMSEISNENDWNNLKADFEQNAFEFISHVERLDSESLGNVFVDPKYGTYERNIEGMIEHAYYHLGQIGLIKKLISKT